MQLRRVVLAAALLVAGCSSGKGTPPTASATLPTAPSTSTTAPGDTAALKQQVEAAYLRSWAVYAKALRTLSVDGLEESFSGGQLIATSQDVLSQASDTRPVSVVVDHNYSTVIIDGITATVQDKYRNHSVLLDPKTGLPVESDPNNDFDETYTLKLIGGTWRVVDILRR
jgi:hypothetical protein